MFGRRARIDELLEEAARCVLLCENCHRKRHWQSDKDSTRLAGKRIILAYLEITECSRCSYNSCIAAFDFHHLDPKQKKIGIGHLITKYSGSWKTHEDLQPNIHTELDKCIVLCANCHRKAHFDEARFIKHASLINSKKGDLKQKNRIDPSRVIAEARKGLDRIAIAAQLCCSPHRIWEILHANGLTTPPHRVNHNKILELHHKGKSSREIRTITGYGRGVILKHIRLHKNTDAHRN